MKSRKAKNSDECSICLVEYKIGDKIMITKCNHAYHKECIYNWYAKSQNCPMCRYVVKKNKRKCPFFKWLFYKFL